MACLRSIKRGWVAALLFTACGDDGETSQEDTTSAGTTATTTGEVTTTGSMTTTTGPDETDTASSETGSIATGGSSDTGGSGDSTSGGPAPADGIPRLYVAGGEAVSVWEIEPETGELTAVQTVEQGATAGPLATTTNHEFLYAVRVNTSEVASFSVDPVTGELTELAVLDVGHRSTYVSVDTTDQWLFTTGFGADLVQIYPIEADGTIGSTPSEDRMVQSRPHAILQDPGGGFVFVPHRDANLIEQYVFDANTGTLTPNDPPSVLAPKGVGPRHMVFAPEADFAYVVNEFGSSVTVYAYDAESGTLTLGDTQTALPPDFTDENTAADIHVTADGQFVYASMRGHDSLAMYSVGDDGSLTSLGNIATEPTPRDFGLGPFGDYLYAAGQGSGMLASYAIEADGTLTAGPLYPVGDDARWVLAVELAPL